MTTSPSSRPFRESAPTIHALTGLRAYAALWVVVSHLSYTEALAYPFGLRLAWRRAAGLIMHEYLGVDLFFMLSGFVLTHVHLEFDEGVTRSRYGRFLLLRLARIYPVHLVGLLLAVVAEKLTPERAMNDAWNLVQHGLLVASWGFSAGISWNLPAWSLSSEWLAYLVFPLVVLGTSSIRHLAAQLLGLVSLVATFYVLMFALPVRLDYFNGMGATVRVLSGAFIGSLLRRLVEHRRVRGLPWGVLLWLNLAVMAITMTDREGHRLPNSIWAYATMVTLLLAAAGGKGALMFPLTSRIPRYLGEISYSIYIIHYPVLRLLRFRFGGLLFRVTTSGSDAEVWVVAACAMLIVLAVASGMHHALEKPFRKWAKTRLAGPRPTEPILSPSRQQAVSQPP